MNKPIKCALLLSAMTALANCGSTVENNTTSGFRSYSSVSSGMSDAITGADSSSNAAYAYAAGSPNGVGLAAYSGVSGSSDMGIPLSGNATFSGDYEVAEISGIFISEDRIFGFGANNTGSMTLSANLVNQSLTGTSDDGYLVVDGDFSGNNLSGDVVYDGVSGNLDGLIGVDGAVGAFHGDGDAMIYAGGFIVD